MGDARTVAQSPYHTFFPVSHLGMQFLPCLQGVSPESRRRRLGSTRNGIVLPESQRGWLFDHDDMIDILCRWWEIIYLYSKCSLTYNSDRLVAISGMARAYSVLVNEPYYAGIWGGEYFLCSLLWSATYEYDEAPIPNLQYLGAPEKNLCHFVSQRAC